MELSWSTFALEIVNFLVLLWILQRFLYRPVLAIIDKRQAGIEKTLSDAKALRAEAESARQKYEGRVAEWEAERQRARESLAQEIEQERARRLEELQSELRTEREKTAAVEERRQAQVRRTLEDTALRHGSRFASSLLSQAAGPDLEARLIETSIADLAALPAERAAQLRGDNGHAPSSITVHSAYPLSDRQREQLGAALKAAVGRELTTTFDRDESLLAGLRITLGSRVLGLNVRDELEGFARLAGD